MVVDTSAILAVLFGEPERDAFATAISEAGVRMISSVNAFESVVVLLARKGAAGMRELDLLLHVAAFDVVPFDDAQLRLARDAYQRYGKGHHPAGLDLGDCCAYALSRQSGDPLLFKGNDLARTDVMPALAG